MVRARGASGWRCASGPTGSLEGSSPARGDNDAASLRLNAGDGDRLPVLYRTGRRSPSPAFSRSEAASLSPRAGLLPSRLPVGPLAQRQPLAPRARTIGVEARLRIVQI